MSKRERRENTSEAVRPLVEQITSGNATRRREAIEDYRALLLRNDNPRQGDAEALREVMRALGRTEDDLARDVAAMGAHARCVELERSLPGLRTAAADASAEAVRAGKQAREILKEADERAFKIRKQAISVRHSAEDRLRQAEKELSRLASGSARWRELAGPDAREDAAAVPVETSEPTPAQEARETPKPDGDAPKPQAESTGPVADKVVRAARPSFPASSGWSNRVGV